MFLKVLKKKTTQRFRNKEFCSNEVKKQLFTGFSLQFHFHFKRKTNEKGVLNFNFDLIELD